MKKLLTRRHQRRLLQDALHLLTLVDEIAQQTMALVLTHGAPDAIAKRQLRTLGQMRRTLDTTPKQIDALMQQLLTPHRKEA